MSTLATSQDSVSSPDKEKQATRLDSLEDDAKPLLLGPEPTEEELATLRKVPDRLPVSAYLIVAVELAERFTYNGLSGVFQNYMQLPRNSTKQTGGLGLGQSTATALSYFMQFWSYLTPIPMALVADMWLGKYDTIVYSSVIYIIGNLILFLTSLPTSIAHGHAKGGLIAAMIIIGIGTGGIKANVSVLVADQYTNSRPYVKTLKSGERVIVDPALTMSSIFSIFFWVISVGSLSTLATTELEKRVDFWAAYLLPFLFFFLAFALVIFGRKYYVRRPPQGSSIPEAAKIVWLAIINGMKFGGYRSHHNEEPSARKSSNPFENGAKKINDFVAKGFRTFTLDIARPSVRQELGLSHVSWDDNFVDQVREALIGCKVFLFYPIHWLVYGQLLTNLISQAGTMQGHGVPNDLMQSIDSIAIIIFVPTLNYLVYPLFDKIGFPLSSKTKIFVGFMLGAVAMAYAAIVEHIIYTSPPCYEMVLKCPASDNGKIPNQVHIAVQTPAQFFIALSQILTTVTGYEVAYAKSPHSMKSFIMSIYLVTSAIGSALGIALSSVSKNPKLIWLYVGLCGAAAVDGILFWIFHNQSTSIEDDLIIMDPDIRERDLHTDVEETKMIASSEAFATTRL